MANKQNDGGAFGRFLKADREAQTAKKAMKTVNKVGTVAGKKMAAKMPVVKKK